MTDEQLEQRLAARLHARFDHAEAPVSLRLRIAADRAALPEPALGWSSWLPRLGGPRLGLVGATAAIVVVAIVALGPLLSSVNSPAHPGLSNPSPASPGPSPSSDPSTWQTTYRIWPVKGPRPAKAESEAAAAIIEARIQALGLGNFTSAIGDDMTFVISGANDPRVYGAILLSMPALPASWASGSFAVETNGEALSLLSITTNTPTDLTYLLGGPYSELYRLSAPGSGPQCHLTVDIAPADGGLTRTLVALSAAPGSATSNTEAVDIPAGMYRLDVMSDCSDWFVRLER